MYSFVNHAKYICLIYKTPPVIYTGIKSLSIIPEVSV